MDIDIVKLKLKKINPNIEILSNEYINSETKLKCKCKIDGAEWSAVWTNLQSGSGCPQCKGRYISSIRTYTIEEIKEKLRVINKNIKILNNNRNGNEKLKCQCLICGNLWESTWGNLKSGKGCPICSRRKIAKSQSFTLEEIKKRLKSINPDIVIISDEYINCKEKITCRCLVCDNEWEVTWDNLSRGRGCPQCLESHGERRIRQYLEANNITFVREYSFPNLLGLGGQLLRFDFAIFNLKQELLFLVEYDGEFHYKKYYETQNFDELRTHDKLKNDYCKDNNISLLRIPYWEFDNIEKIIEDFMRDLYIGSMDKGEMLFDYRNKI